MTAPVVATETWTARFVGDVAVPVRVDRHVDAERGEWFCAHAEGWPGVPYKLHRSGNTARYAVERVVAEGLSASRTGEAGCGFEGVSPPVSGPEAAATRWYAQGPEPREGGYARHSVCCGTRAEDLREADDSHVCVAVAWGDTEEDARRVAEQIAEDHNEAERRQREMPARRDVVAGVLAAMAAGVGPGGDAFPRAAATQAAFDEAEARWRQVAVHGTAGLALYDRDGAGSLTLRRMATQEEDDAFICVHQTMAAALLAWRSAAEGARADRDEAERLRSENRRLRDREEHFAALLRVADGGQYRNDWGGAVQRLIEGRDAARAALADAARGGLPRCSHCAERFATKAYVPEPAVTYCDRCASDNTLGDDRWRDLPQAARVRAATGGA